jgi:hypothetical protein
LQNVCDAAAAISVRRVETCERVDVLLESGDAANADESRDAAAGSRSSLITPRAEPGLRPCRC